MKIVAKKNLGQHFCNNQIILNTMIETTDDISNKCILEIGPGTGMLSKEILKKNPKELIMIEKDIRCIPLLEDIKKIYKNTTIINDDITQYNFTKNFTNKKPITVIANLPYNISSVIIIHLLKNINIFEKLTLMFQKEVAERITALPNSKSYGRLSILVGILCNTKYIMTVLPQNFYPKPKVDSAIITLTPKNHSYDQHELFIINQIAKITFLQRRKQLKKSLNFIPNIIQHLKNIHINPQDRPENLQIKDFYNIAKIPTIQNIISKR